MATALSPLLLLLVESATRTDRHNDTDADKWALVIPHMHIYTYLVMMTSSILSPEPSAQRTNVSTLLSLSCQLTSPLELCLDEIHCAFTCAQGNGQAHRRTHIPIHTHTNPHTSGRVTTTRGHTYLVLTHRWRPRRRSMRGRSRGYDSMGLTGGFRLAAAPLVMHGVSQAPDTHSQTERGQIDVTCQCITGLAYYRVQGLESE